MTNTQQATTLTNIGVAMFTVNDVDAAIAFYTEKLGFELRADVSFGEQGDNRWVEVAPPGSTARLALNPPMGSEPGHAGIGVETTDVDAEYERLTALGIKADPPMDVPGAPKLFMIQDPDGNHIAVVQPAA
ncbi:MAG: VOC family protein [Solirubrobacteraceae bacterium]|nr:VOC family protein [Solirubrobacteraceae bacterium]